jgi:integrase
MSCEFCEPYHQKIIDGENGFCAITKNGADLYTVSKLLGHKAVTTAQIYTKVLDEGRKKAVEQIPDISL